MSKINAFLFILIASLIVISCKNKDSPEPFNKYSFFVAGHTYGKPGGDHLGFHPPFKSEFSFIQMYPNNLFGILTGDIVQHSNEESWDIIDGEIEELGLPLFFAPGNHDTYNYELYKQRYGDPENDYRTYGYFRQENDIFILLDANLDEWNISNEQLIFLQNALDSNMNGLNNVFVFVHQLIWWDEYTVFKNIVTNWSPYTPDTTNYWGTLETIFQNYQTPVFLFAGDLGANDPATPYMYFEDNNITYIAGGMGSDNNDNYLFVSVDKYGVVDFDLIALQGSRDRFGKLEDYILP